MRGRLKALLALPLLLLPTEQALGEEEPSLEKRVRALEQWRDANVTQYQPESDYVEGVREFNRLRREIQEIKDFVGMK